MHSLLATLLAQAQGQQSPFGGILFLAPAFMLIVYFMMIRPQRKQEDDQKKFLGGLQKGDEVITASGIVGKVDKVADGVIFLEVASNVRIRVIKSQIAGPYKPAAEAPEAAAAAEKK